MKRVMTICLSALIAMTMAGTPAGAQKQKQRPAATGSQNFAIGILDLRRLLRDSAAAKNVRPQIVRLREAFQKQIRDRENTLRQAEQKLLEQRAVLAPDAFAERRRKFQERARAARQEVQSGKRAIDRAQALAMRKIELALLKIARDVATEKGLNIIMAKSSVLLSLKNLEVTGEVMKRLNKSLPKILVKVEKPKAGKARRAPKKK